MISRNIEKHLPHPCKKCDFKTFRLKELSKHINRQHKDKSMLSCEKCKFYIKTKQFVNQHLLKHSNSELKEKYAVKLVDDKKKIYYCNDCKYQNPAYTNLKQHVGTYHLGIKYQCE